MKHQLIIQFGFSEFFCVALCLQNTLMITDYEILKYIKKIFKVQISVFFNTWQRTLKNSIEKLNST